mmetsp:Transcript_18536/g.25611  ORF Transcript_18536/g.25611 Transcript_18536/m.25611 type:complete len:210 (-) Transcript_18536:115-744(-)
MTPCSDRMVSTSTTTTISFITLQKTLQTDLGVYQSSNLPQYPMQTPSYPYHLKSIPRFTAALVSKHPPITVATATGHLDQRRQGLDSTKTISQTPAAIEVSDHPNSTLKEDEDSNDDLIPLDNDHTVYTKLFDTADFDCTGRFPVPSSGSREAYHFVSCYNGYIHVEAMTSRTSSSYIAAYDRTFQHWSKHGSVPSIVRLIPILSDRKP